MAIWRYIAVEIPKANASGSPRRRRGQLAATSAAEVRQSLRRVGLQVIDIQPDRHFRMKSGEMSRGPWYRTLYRMRVSVRIYRDRFLRKRRRPLCAELFDSLATMIESGLPLAESLDALLTGEDAPAGSRSSKSLRYLMMALRTSITDGASLHEAMRTHPDWFNEVDMAMIEAARHAGSLDRTLRQVADREERTDQLTQRLISALMYPSIVMLAAIGVTIFLSTKTLPDLTSILSDAGVAIPPLTSIVMMIGQFFARYGIIIAPLVLIGVPLLLILVNRIADRSWYWRKFSHRFIPRVWKSMMVGLFATSLAELVRSGIPVVEAFRIIAPTMPGALGRYLQEAADRVENGESLSSVFTASQDGVDHDTIGAAYFTPEFRRLIETAQVSGDLAPMLDRIGERYRRQAVRRIDRLAALLEPTAIILLAILVGTVVMAAILPLIHLQEVVR